MSETLSAYLDRNIAFVEREAVGKKGDLAPMLAWVTEDGDYIKLLDMHPQRKAAEMARCRTLMREQGAVRYALIAAAWALKLDPAEEKAARQIVGESGTGHPVYRQRRVEIYMVSVGDRAGSLVATLEVARNKHTGRITGLTRMAGTADRVEGRMTNLLSP